MLGSSGAERAHGVSAERAGHDLETLASRAGLRPPVASADLLLLSRAYLGARYPPFPPLGAPTNPLALYSEHDAEAAYQTASTLVAWGSSTTQVESSLSSTRDGDGALMYGHGAEADLRDIDDI